MCYLSPQGPFYIWQPCGKPCPPLPAPFALQMWAARRVWLCGGKGEDAGAHTGSPACSMLLEVLQRAKGGTAVGRPCLGIPKGRTEKIEAGGSRPTVCYCGHNERKLKYRFVKEQGRGGLEDWGILPVRKHPRIRNVLGEVPIATNNWNRKRATRSQLISWQQIKELTGPLSNSALCLHPAEGRSTPRTPSHTLILVRHPPTWHVGPQADHQHGESSQRSTTSSPH